MKCSKRIERIGHVEAVPCPVWVGRGGNRPLRHSRPRGEDGCGIEAEFQGGRPVLARQAIESRQDAFVQVTFQVLGPGNWRLEYENWAGSPNPAAPIIEKAAGTKTGG